MKLVHLSDLHLGSRVFPRVERGGNLRERDLAGAFHQAVHEIGRLHPDLVLLAGDLFDHPDPPSTAFLALTRGIRRLRELLPEVPVLAVAGAADTPLVAGDPGPVAVLDAIPGVEAAAGAPRSVRVSRLGLHALLVPHRAVVRPPFPELRPDPDARWNILLVRGTPAEGRREDAPPVDPAEWDYVAVGGPHQATSWGRGMRSSGSLERVGVDPWAEAGEEKGFLFVDLAEGSSAFHPVRTRPVVDLAPVRVDPADPEAGTRRLRELLESYPGGVDGKLLRVRLRGPILDPTEGVSPALLSGIRRRAAHLEVRVEEEGGDPLGERGGGGRTGDPHGGVRAQEEEPGGAGPTLSWSPAAGRGSQVRLGPGLWVATAPLDEELDRLGEGLARAARGGAGGGGEVEPLLSLSLETGTWTTLTGDSLAAVFAPLSGTPSAPPPPATPPEPSPDPPLSDAELHAEWIEVEGDAEARALDWARERQEADSRLLAYREHARELRDRIHELKREGPDARCPSCRRPLSEAHPGLLELLEEEWEEVVQDGSWWKRRRAQLDDKPPDLLALERRALALRARLESGGVSSSPAPPVEAVPALPPALLRRASIHLHRATAGVLAGVVEGGARVVEGSGRRRPLAPGEAGLVALALQVAGVELGHAEARRSHEAEGSLAQPSGAGVHLLMAGNGVAGPALVRFLEGLALPGAAIPGATWLALVPHEVAQALHPHLAGTVELARDEAGRPRIRVGGAGRARVALAGSGEGLPAPGAPPGAAPAEPPPSPSRPSPSPRRGR